MNKVQVNVLELFAGTKSIGKVAKQLGYNVFSTDIDDRFNTDYTINILDFDVDKVPWKPYVIWASPPCTTFSISSYNYYWEHDLTPKTEEAVISYKLVEKTIELINYFNPKYWYIENPRGLLRKFPIMMNLPIRQTVTYSSYGDSRNKPTDIWTNNSNWKPKKLYEPSELTIKEKYKNSTDLAKIPYNLCLEILKNI